MNGPDCIAAMINHAWHEVYVMERLFPFTPAIGVYKESLAALTRWSNDQLFTIVEEIGDRLQRDNAGEYDVRSLEDKPGAILERLIENRNQFIFQNQQWLIERLDEELSVGT